MFVLVIITGAACALGFAGTIALHERLEPWRVRIASKVREEPPRPVRILDPSALARIASARRGGGELSSDTQTATGEVSLAAGGQMSLVAGSAKP